VDRHQRPRHRPARHPHRRIGLRPLPLRAQGRARRRLQNPRRPRRITNPRGDRAAFIEDVRRALYCSKIISYAQGYMLLRAAAKENGWNLNMGGIALMWRGGCIIRSRFLGKIKEAFDKNPRTSQPAPRQLLLRRPQQVPGLVAQGFMVRAIEARRAHDPAFSTALAFFDGYRMPPRLPANLLQAQRDYFGAHTYERVDQPRGQFFHTNWTGHGGRVSSTTYSPGFLFIKGERATNFSWT
jgi:6-phosphogluconate dehydrogenase